MGDPKDITDTGRVVVMKQANDPFRGQRFKTTTFSIPVATARALAAELQRRKRLGTPGRQTKGRLVAELVDLAAWGPPAGDTTREVNSESAILGVVMGAVHKAIDQGQRNDLAGEGPTWDELLTALTQDLIDAATAIGAMRRHFIDGHEWNDNGICSICGWDGNA